jgi:quercetin dioxygenase-like cupin family protein
MPAAHSQDSGLTAIRPVADLKWSDAGVPGVATAVVRGDMTKGPSHFYLRYAAGFVAPLHHHSPDHYATMITGNLHLIVEGKAHALGPGSYFALTNKAKHAARCEGSQPCVMFIDARGPWDVVVADK